MATKMETPPPPVNILVVDDQAGIRLTLKGILSKKGYNVVVADSGLQAIAEARKTKFSLVFMDIKMPGISGVDAFIKIKEISPGTSVILMTAYAMEDEIRRAIREGAYTIVYKPFDMEKILTLIAECLGTRALVLVVDDRIEDRSLLRTIMESKGYAVVTAESGEDCLRMILEKRFQVILLDIRLPGIDGLVTLREIKKTRPDTTVIMLTAMDNEELVKEAMANGSFAFMRKPFEIKELLSIVQKSLQSPAKQVK